jgi:PAS domain S-box-containing protein
MPNGVTNAPPAQGWAEQLLDSMPDAVITLDQQWRFTYVNPQWERTNGAPREQWLGKCLWDLFPDEVGGTFHRMYHKAVAQRVTIDFEAFFPPHKNWYMVRAFPTSEGLVVYAREINQRKTAEAERRRLDALVARKTIEMDAAIQSIPDAMYIGNAQGLTHCNAATLAMAGAPSLQDLKQAIAGLAKKTSVRSAADGRPIPEDHLPFLRALRGETVTGEELIVTTIDGNADTYIRCTAAPVVVEGQIVGAVGINADITERKKMEEMLRRHESLLAEAQQVARVGSWNWDLLTDEITWTDEHYRIVGLRPQAIPMTAERAVSYIHPDDRAAAWDSVNRALRDRQPYEWRLRMVREDGALIVAQSRGQATYDPQGTPVRMCGTIQDVTALTRAEEEMRAAKATAEAANQAKDQFLANLSHELRTPLTSILLWAKMLDAGTVDPARYPDVFRALRESAEAQRQLIGDLLDSSAMLAGKLRIDMRDVELVPLVKHAIEVVRPAADEKGIEIDFALSGPAGARVTADPDRFRQVIWNLLSNAVKFTSHGGRVHVRLHTTAGEHVQIEIADTGDGIDAQLLPHVFDRFRQADASNTRTHGGLGLGLAITRHLVEMHGGTIRADSAGKGRGATFTVQLPLADTKADTSATAPNAAAANREDPPRFVPSPILKGVRTLLVEDDPSIRAAVRWILEQSQAEVTAVESAADALDALRARARGDDAFDVLVSDIGLPEVDGYDLMREVRKQESEAGHDRPIPALAMTGYAHETDRQKALAAGFHQYLPKPIDPAALISVVATLARR